MEHLLNLRKLSQEITPKGEPVRTLYNRVLSAVKGAKGVLTNDELKKIEAKLKADHTAMIKHFQSLRVPVKKGKAS